MSADDYFRNGPNGEIVNFDPRKLQIAHEEALDKGRLNIILFPSTLFIDLLQRRIRKKHNAYNNLNTHLTSFFYIYIKFRLI